jgi:DNA-binding MarR family transcriptional regulator
MSGLSKRDYESLLAFRVALRGFLHLVDERARSVGLTPQQHQVLLAIMGQPGRKQASVGDIASALYISHNAAVGLVNRCQQLGMVTRTPDEHDRRTVWVSLTERGSEVLEKLSAANLQELRSLTKALRFTESSDAQSSP